MATSTPSPSPLSTLASAALTVAEQNKPAILAALATHNASLESFLVSAIKADIKNPLLALLVSEMVPQIVKSFPSMEDAAFAAFDTYLRAEVATL